MPVQDSLLPTNCNNLLATALNHRVSNDLDWFAMQHTDVEPEPWWIDRLIAIADEQNADLVSALVPVKNESGSYSTVIAAPRDPYGYFTQLNSRQVYHQTFPSTFGITEAAEALESLPGDLRVENVPRSALLVNTGCMIYRLSHWRYGVRFRNLDDLIEQDGVFRTVHQSEDFYFSQSVAECGGRVMATRLVHVKHHGTAVWESRFDGVIRESDSQESASRVFTR
jgi:hypothetical protein